MIESLVSFSELFVTSSILLVSSGCKNMLSLRFNMHRLIINDLKYLDLRFSHLSLVTTYACPSIGFYRIKFNYRWLNGKIDVDGLIKKSRELLEYYVFITKKFYLDNMPSIFKNNLDYLVLLSEKKSYPLRFF